MSRSSVPAWPGAWPHGYWCARACAWRWSSAAAGWFGLCRARRRRHARAACGVGDRRAPHRRSWHRQRRTVARVAGSVARAGVLPGGRHARGLACARPRRDVAVHEPRARRVAAGAGGAAHARARWQGRGRSGTRAGGPLPAGPAARRRRPARQSWRAARTAVVRGQRRRALRVGSGRGRCCLAAVAGHPCTRCARLPRSRRAHRMAGRGRQGRARRHAGPAADCAARSCACMHRT